MGARGWRALTGLALAAAVLAGCTGDDGEKETQPTTPVEETTEPSTTAARRTPTTLDVAALDTSSENWDQVMRNIIAIREEAFRRPDPSLIDLIFDGTCECHKVEREWAVDLVERGERYVDEGVKIISVQKIGDFGPGTATIRQIDRQGPQLVEDRVGKVRRVGEGWPPTEWTFYLRMIDGRWKVLRIENQGPES